MPGGLTGHFFRKFFAMLTWFAIVMIVAGTFLSHPVQTVGFEILGVTVFLWLIKDCLERFTRQGIRGKRGPRATAVFAIVFVLAFVSVLVMTERWLNPWLQCHGLTL